MNLERIAKGLLGQNIEEEEIFIGILTDHLGDITDVNVQQFGEQLCITSRTKISTMFSILNSRLAKYGFRVHEINDDKIWIISDNEINRRSAERED